jgi:hypothetical protein
MASFNDLRDRRVGLILLLLPCAFAALVVGKYWNRLSIIVIAWIAFAVFWGILLRITTSRSQAALRALLANERAGPTDEESLARAVLEVVGHLSNRMLLLCVFSIMALLMAVASILSGH